MSLWRPGCASAQHRAAPSRARTSWAPGEAQALRGLSQAAGWVEGLQWHLKAQPRAQVREGAQGREGTPDSPLVVRLPKSKTGEGLVLPRGPAEGVLGGLVGEPWAMATKVGPPPRAPLRAQVP